MPKILKNAIEIRKNIDKLSQLGGRTGTSKMLFMDVTGGTATKIYQKIKSLYDEHIDNKTRINILKEIISSEGFSKYESNIFKFATLNKNDVEFPNNIDGAHTLTNLGYKVYMLPNIMNSKSADFILEKQNKLFYSELKTIYGKSPKTVIQQLKEGASQSDRIIVNVVGNISPRNLADGIKDFYIDNQYVKEIKVLKGGKPINVDIDAVNKKKFNKNFMSKWSR